MDRHATALAHIKDTRLCEFCFPTLILYFIFFLEEEKLLKLVLEFYELGAC